MVKGQGVLLVRVGLVSKCLSPSWFLFTKLFLTCQYQNCPHKANRREREEKRWDLFARAGHDLK